MIKKTSVSRCTPDSRYLHEQPEDILFFDIETTGLSPKRSHLYLIGCVSFDGSQWNITQWFAENSSEEFAILEAFLQYAAGFSRLITFNGASFDIPYLKEKCSDYLLSEDPLQLPSTDLYRVIKPYRRLLSLKQLGQTHVERWLGLYREDCYNGGELIRVYSRYRKDKSRHLLQTLLLHNLEDLEGMLFCLSMLAYHDAFQGRYRFLNAKPDIGATPASSVVFSFSLDAPVPKPLDFSCTQGSLRAEADRLSVTLPVTDGAIRCYYPDYEHYMLLPREHVLIHKKLAKITDISGAVSAALETCYQQIPLTGRFLSDEKNIKKVSEHFLNWILRYVSEKR